MCEVEKEEGEAHKTNSRAILRAVLDAGASKLQGYFGFEQEYTLFSGHRPLGWPTHGFPGPQGPYYCGVGHGKVFGREIAEEHALLCIDAGIMYTGCNAEVMPSQWEFQIGHRNNDNEDSGPLNVSDHLWIARWLLKRVSENYGVDASFAGKPVAGEWNGAGLHTNFSTQGTRNPKNGMKEIDKITHNLEQKHEKHIKIYGENLSARLTGQGETCHIDEFKSGIASRSASVRIPRLVAARGYGYLEDRRPSANADPYLVSAAILATSCGIDFEKIQI